MHRMSSAHLATAVLLPALMLAAVVEVRAQPERQQVAGHSLMLVSDATRSHLFGLVDVYRVALYAASRDTSLTALQSADMPKALRVAILYDGSMPDRIPSAWREELMPPLSGEQQQALRAKYAALTPDAHILITYTPGTGTMVSVSGQHAISDSGQELMAAFLDLWMGQTPVSESLKKSLLEGVPGARHQLIGRNGRVR